ncbi:MAG: 50S ribosomal protein L5, partial [Anaerolineales bacterium]|nr:50S ribosomal protein L5 [Anaerolineales bacterium]
MAKPEQAAKPEQKKEPKGAKGAPPPATKEKKGAAGKRPKSATLPRLKERYRKEILPALMREFNYQNVMQAPRVQKVVVNIGVGEAIGNAKALDAAVKDMTAIVGQKPFVRKAKKS